jgi:hypothetical protein
MVVLVVVVVLVLCWKLNCFFLQVFTIIFIQRRKKDAPVQRQDRLCNAEDIVVNMGRRR